MDAAVAEKICAIRENLAGRIGPDRFDTWFGRTAQFNLTSERLDIAVPSRFVGEWIEAHYLAAVTDVAREVLGPTLTVDIRVAPADGDFAHAPGSAESDRDGRGVCPGEGAVPRARRLLRGELDTFVVGPSNALAHALACSVAESLDQQFKPLVFHAGCGLGKTHLLHGICNAVARRHPHAVRRYISGEEFTNEFVSAVKAGRIDAFRSRFRSVDVLLIDDIHFLANKRATQEEFLHTFNAIDGCGRQIVLSSDVHPRAIANMSDPLVNRLISGMVVKIGPPAFRTRREILRRRAEELRCTVPDDVLDFVAQHVSSNVRELEGALCKLVALSSLNKDPITLALARTALEDQLIRAHRPTEASEIERVVAGHFGCTREMLHSAMRSRTVSLARAIAMHLIRKHTHLSFPEIGRMMGNKNHSTVLMASRRIEAVLRAGGAVWWMTSSGKQEAPLASLLESIESGFHWRRG